MIVALVVESLKLDCLKPMMQCITRRTAIQLFSGASFAALAGCQGDFPSSRVIDFIDVTTKPANDEWNLTTTVRTRDNTGRGFKNVRVAALSENSEVICSETIGDMSVSDRQSKVMVTLTCPTLPAVLVPLSEVSPCEDNTSIYKRVYRNESGTWEEQLIECDDA